MLEFLVFLAVVVLIVVAVRWLLNRRP